MPVVMFCNKRRALCRLAFAYFLILAVNARALIPELLLSQYHINAWSEREGLPHSTVQAIAQTPDGYLWVGTRDGLARFDGVTFKAFKSETEPGLAASDIRALHRSRDGSYGSARSTGVSRYAKGQFDGSNFRTSEAGGR
jgi:ligand-binding sensor domain-containing protein